MNLNYEGSVAQRFFKFTSGLATTEDVEVDVFDSISIFIPSDMASANIVDWNGTGLTASTPIVKTVTADNYTSVMKGELLAQWKDVFNEGTNFDVTLYLVVFFMPASVDDYTLTVTKTSIDYAPLTAAFKLTYPASFFKCMLWDKVTEKAFAYSMYDLELCLARLCENETKLSYHLCQVEVDYDAARAKIDETEDEDANDCWVLSATRAEEREAVAENGLATVIPTVTSPREAYFWGMLDIMDCTNTFVIVHTEADNIIPVMLAKYFSFGKNNSGTYIGNKVAKVRLGGKKVKPTGTPSVFNSEVNTNLPEDMYTILDDKNCQYLISIADSTVNNAEIVREKGITGVPLTARLISKYVDYTTSQNLARLTTADATGKKPYLRNQESYEIIQSMLLSNLQRFAGKIVNIATNFPAFADLPASKTDITVSSGWTAEYISDLEKVQISGTITY